VLITSPEIIVIKKNSNNDDNIINMLAEKSQGQLQSEQ
jgi:hypothetical protein